MAARFGTRLAGAGLALSVLLSAGPLPLLAFLAKEQLTAARVIPEVLLVVGALCYSGVGALIAVRLPANRVGWLLLLTGLLSSATIATAAYGLLATQLLPGSLPFGIWAAWAFTWMIWLVLAAIPLPLLVFPDGRPPSARWWIVGALLIGSGALLALLTMLRPGDLLVGPNSTGSPGPNPAGLTFLADPYVWFFKPVNSLYLATVVAAAAAPIWRWRRSRGDVRQQLKVLAYVGGWVIALLVLTYLTPLRQVPDAANLLWVLSTGGLLIGLPTAAAVAVLRYHLYDIDPVINKTLVFAGLALFVTASYVVIVAGLGALIGRAGQSSLPLSILATAVVAVAFQPVRMRAQALANRLVYGRRADPNEVLSRLSELVAESSSGEHLLVRLLQLVVEATGVAAAAIYWDGDAKPVLAARWPAGTADVTGRTFPIRHQGDEIGRLLVAGAPDPMPGASERLMIDVAGQAGLLLHNLRLTTELEARVEELAESRLRIVAAQDAERRRLERDIHDGVQQHVVALMAKLQLARNQIGRHSDRSAATLAEAQSDAGRLVDELRELAGGIHPTVLTDGGVFAAVRFRADRLPIKVVLDADPAIRAMRYPERVEAAGYFIACEALANVLKHAGASRATVSIGSESGALTIKVADDGSGFDPATAVRSGLRGLQDRVDALGGRLQVISSRGAGTTLSASLPADG